MPIQSVIEAKDLQQALKRFPDAMEKTVLKLMEESKKAEEKKESKIIIPGR